MSSAGNREVGIVQFNCHAEARSPEPFCGTPWWYQSFTECGPVTLWHLHQRVQLHTQDGTGALGVYFLSAPQAYSQITHNEWKCTYCPDMLTCWFLFIACFYVYLFISVSTFYEMYEIEGCQEVWNTRKMPIIYHKSLVMSTLNLITVE